MTFVKELPPCNCRYGRTEIIETEDGKKKTARIIVCCGYREVDIKECIEKCTGFPNAKFGYTVESLIKLSNDFKFRRCINCDN